MRPALILLLVFLCTSCTRDDICIVPQIVQTQMGLYIYNADSTKSYTNLDVGSFCVQNDTCYYSIEEVPSNPILFLNPKQNQQTFELSDDANGDLDEFTIFYSPELTFINSACGFQYFFNIDSVTFTNTFIDSINIQSPLVTDERNKEHLAIVLSTL